MKKENPRTLSKRQELEGKRYVNNKGCWYIINVFHNSKNIDIQFDDGVKLFGIKHNNILTGEVKNPYHPTIYGRGFKGVGRHEQWVNGKKTIMYIKWHNMFTRCYDPLFHKRSPNYIGCEVDERWWDFQVFGDWFEEYYVEGHELDKDLLIKRNKTYSPETCCFISKYINGLLKVNRKTRGECLIGVHYRKDWGKFQVNSNLGGTKYFDDEHEAFNYYKEDKEQQFRNAAEEVKDTIPNIVYQALYNRIVETTD